MKPIKKHTLQASLVAIKKVKQIPITLIEVVIAIGIIAIVAALLTFNFNQAVSQQRFLSDVTVVTEQLRLAQDLMLMMPADFHVRLKPTRAGLQIWIETDASLTEGWSKELERKNRLLKGIRYAKFEEQHPYPTKVEGIDVKFFSGGSSMSKGYLFLAQNTDGSGPLSQTICLHGYPHPIRTIPSTKEEINCFADDSQQYNDSITRYTVEEVEFYDSSYGKAIPETSTPPTNISEDQSTQKSGNNNSKNGN